MANCIAELRLDELLLVFIALKSGSPDRSLFDRRFAAGSCGWKTLLEPEKLVAAVKFLVG